MLERFSRYRVLKVFLDSPTKEFGLREISRESKLSPVSVLKYLKEFESKELIRILNRKEVPIYHANRDSENFIFYKKLGILYELHNSGLIEHLWHNLAPDALILYGSHAKGESIEDSDIDIFVVGKEKKIDLEKFEKKLGKEVHLIFDSNVKNIPKELKNNLINGIILKGYFKLL